MSPSKIQNPIDEFTAHGVKTVGDYQYVLLVDGEGACYIERVATDESSIKFCKMPHVDHTTFAEIATQIDAFWVSPESHSYVYIFQC